MSCGRYSWNVEIAAGLHALLIHPPSPHCDEHTHTEAHWKRCVHVQQFHLHLHSWYKNQLHLQLPRYRVSHVWLRCDFCPLVVDIVWLITDMRFTWSFNRAENVSGTKLKSTYVSEKTSEDAQVEFLSLTMASFHLGELVPGLWYCTFSPTGAGDRMEPSLYVTSHTYDFFLWTKPRSPQWKHPGL